MMEGRLAGSWRWSRLLLAGGISILAVLVVAVGLSRADEPQVSAAAANAADSYLYRYDPVAATFFTITLPAGTRPTDVAVISNATNLEVWFTGTGTNVIGRLIFTSTASTTLITYPVPTANSYALHLATGGGYVWFTERDGNKVGRLDPGSGTIDEFPVATTTVGLADLTYVSDGTVWFAETQAEAIGQLVVDSPIVYTITEFTDASLVGGHPYGIAWETTDKIWVALPDLHKLARYRPSQDQWVISAVFTDSGKYGDPFQLTMGPYNMPWMTDPGGNRLAMFLVSTFSDFFSYEIPTADSFPWGLEFDQAGDLWFSESRQPQIGRLDTTSPGSFDEFHLPDSQATPRGLAVDPSGNVWVVAWRPHRIFLPLIMRRFPAPIPILGIQTYGVVNEATGLASLADLEPRWVRVPVYWSSVEPADVDPSGFNWTNVDTTVSNLYDAGIHLIMTIEGNPSWAADYPGSRVYPEREADFTEFIQALVERYDGDGVDDASGSPVVQYWELYNEVDFGSVFLAEAGYGYFGHDPQGYVDMLRLTHQAIQATNPDAKLLNGGLAWEIFEDEGGNSVRDFLDKVLTYGGGQYIDIFNFHSYAAWDWQWEQYGRGLIGKTNYFRSKLASYGLSKPFFLTETGYTSDPLRGGSDELQSRYVVKVFARGYAAELGAVVWFLLKDITTGFPYLYGLLDSGMTPKPAYITFQTTRDQLGGAWYVRTLTTAETGSADVEGYSFSAASDNRLDVLWAEDDAAHVVNIQANTIKVTDKYGAQSFLSDADDGTVDGVIPLTVDGSPVFVEYTS